MEKEPLMHAARLNMALFAVLCLAIPLHAQEKPAWTASPSVVYQHNGNYPNAVLVRLFFNACGQNNNGLPTSGPLTGTFKITVTGVGVTASQPDPLPPGSTTCSLTTTLTIPASAQPGMEAINITNDGKENGFAFINFLDATAGPTPDKPEGERRVFVVGDSCVFDVDASGATLPDLIGQRLAQEGRPDVKVFNFGVRSSLICDWVSHPPGIAPDGSVQKTPFITLAFDFVLAPVHA